MMKKQPGDVAPSSVVCVDLFLPWPGGRGAELQTRSLINDPEVNCPRGFLTLPVADTFGKYYICCKRVTCCYVFHNCLVFYYILPEVLAYIFRS
jgi:hypothetical protein